MDLRAFTEENFDPVNWINETLNTAPKDSDIENYAASLVFKLQLFVSEINNTVHETALSVLGNIPKFNQDIDSLCEEARIFKEKMVSIDEDLNGLNKGSEERINEIEKLNEAKKAIDEKLAELSDINNPVPR